MFLGVRCKEEVIRLKVVGKRLKIEVVSKRYYEWF